MNGSGQTIAIVDDDPRLLDSLEDLLESADYRTQRFSSANALLERGLLHIDVLISDIGMPGINGFELFSIARRVRPDLPVFLITGRHEIEGSHRAGEISGFFRKPFDGRALLLAIRKVLSERNREGDNET